MHQSPDLEACKEQARAVHPVVAGVPDLAGAFRYAVELTHHQGGRAIAAPNRDPVFSPARRCVRGGAGAHVCPIPSPVGGHIYGHVYFWVIGLILTYFCHGRQNAQAIVQNCLFFATCKAVCPAGIDLPHLIKETYAEGLRQGSPWPIKNRLPARVLKDRRLFHFILRRAWLAQKLAARFRGRFWPGPGSRLGATG